MSQLSRTALKAFYETGDFPTEAQFSDFIDSCLNFVSDNINSELLGNCYFISKNGNDSTGLKGTDLKPFLTIAAVLAVYSAGDTIVLFPGTWDETFILSTSVNFFFYPGAKIIYTGSATNCIEFAAGTAYTFSGDVHIERTAGSSTDTVLLFSSSTVSQIKFSNATIISNSTLCIDFNTSNSSIRFESSLLISSSSISVINIISVTNVAFIDTIIRSKSSSGSVVILNFNSAFSNLMIFKNVALVNDFVAGFSFNLPALVTVAMFTNLNATVGLTGFGFLSNSILGTSLLVDSNTLFPFE